MSEYLKEFDAKIGALETAINAVSSQLERQIPGLNRRSVNRIFRSIRSSLALIDRGKIRYPELLAHPSGSVPQRLIAFMDEALSYANQSGTAFAQHALPTLVDLLARMEQAAGVETKEVEDFQKAALSDLKAIVSEADGILEKTSTNSTAVNDLLNASERAREAIAARLDESEKAFSAIADIKKKVDALASPDGRVASSIEKQFRVAAAKAKQVTDARDEAVKLLEEAKNQAVELKSALDAANAEHDKIRKIREESEGVLKLATQAGLAASYRSERNEIRKNEYIFTVVFYVAIVATLVIAVGYVLPAFEAFISSNGNVSAFETAFIALTRVAVLAPLIWAIHFTSQRIQKLELLQVDYAEKAAVSLAYSGYRDEMNDDADLLRKLKDGLLTRFSEHPERLLNKPSRNSTFRIDDNGVSASE